MQKFGNLGKWKSFKPGAELRFKPGRRVRLQVRTPFDAMWTANGQFLTCTSGAEVIEFVVAEGELTLCCSAQSCVYTSDWEVVHLPESTEPSFVRVANRQPRNYEYERIAHMAAQNVARRYEAMMEEERRERIAMAEASGKKVDHETGEVRDDDDDGQAQRSSGGDVSSEKPAAPKSPARMGGGKGEKGGGGKTSGKAESRELSDGDDGAGE